MTDSTVVDSFGVVVDDSVLVIVVCWVTLTILAITISTSSSPVLENN